MNKLIRDIPNEVIEELERRAAEMHLKPGTYMRLLLIHAAVRQEKSAVKEWAASQRLPAHQRTEETLTERDRYQLAVDTGTVEHYHDDLRREAFRRDEQQKEGHPRGASQKGTGVDREL